MSKRPRGTGAIFSVPGSRNLWVGYTGTNGEYIRESCGSPRKTDARNFLKARMEAVSGGNFLGPRVEKITVDELYDDLLQDYRTHGKDVEWAEGRWKVHLKDYFGGMRAARVGTTQIAGYVEKRQGEKAAKATLNRELALLRRAFSIGFDAEPQKVSRVPKFHRFIVSEKGNERRGFIEEAQYRKLTEQATDLWLRGFMALAYNYGFRKGELLSIRCSQVDLLNDTVCLYSGETKNDEGRIVALTEECKKLLTELRKGKQPEDFLFTRENGERVLDFRGAWDSLTRKAGLPGLLLHDFRRSAVRNMIRRGVPQKTAREISGHKTDTVFSRYNIVSEADIRDAAHKIEQGAKAAIHSSFTVAQEQGNEERTENARKPKESVS
jgi:integrase